MSLFPRCHAWQPLTVPRTSSSSVFGLHPLVGVRTCYLWSSWSLSFPEVPGSCLNSQSSIRTERRRPTAMGQPPEGGLNKQVLARERGNSRPCCWPTFTPLGVGGREERSIWGEPALQGQVLGQPWPILSSTFQGRCYCPHFREQETEAQRGGGSQLRAFGDKLLGSPGPPSPGLTWHL